MSTKKEDTIESCIEALFPSTVSRGICSFIYVYKNGTFAPHRMHPCHASLAHVPHVEDLVALYTSLWVIDKEYIPQAKEFWRYILNRRISPWKEVLKGSEIIYNKNGEMVAIKLTNFDVPAELFQSFCIATRIPREHFRQVRAFSLFKENGFTNAEALFLSSHFAINERNEMNHLRQMGHHPFDNRVSFRRLNESDPNASRDHLFSKGHTYVTRRNCVVDSFGAGVETKPEAVYLSDVEYKGPFTKRFRRYHGIAPGRKPTLGRDQTLDPLKSIEHFKKTRSIWRQK